MTQLLVLALVVGFLVGAVLTAVFARRFAKRQLKDAEERAFTFEHAYTKCRSMLVASEASENKLAAEVVELRKQVTAMSDRRGSR